jgi:hypothetical protein
VLSAAISLLPPAAAGLAALAGGTPAAPGFGFLGLFAAAVFVVLLGLFGTVGPEEAPRPGFAADLPPRMAALFALAFVAFGALSAGLAWEVWRDQGATSALGLVAAAIAFVSVALALGGRALRR